MSDDLMSLRLLVVSDSASERDFWRRGAGLASVPVDVNDVATASAAGDALKRGGVDIVVIDAEMTGATDIARAARALPVSPLVFSAALPKSAGGGRIDGCDGVVRKPVSIDDARDAVNRCIKAKMPTRVMIVDDSGTMRAIVRKILGASRFTLDVSDASEGAAALGKIKSGSVDLVFLDYNMPGLNGIETLSEIKRETPGVAVVMMTSTVDPAVAERAKTAGAATFLKKPFFPKDVDEVLGRHHGLHAIG